MATSQKKVNRFCITDYKDLINNFLNLGYEFVFIEKIDRGKAQIFLRHDVDLCLERAAMLAEVEKSCQSKEH